MPLARSALTIIAAGGAIGASPGSGSGGKQTGGDEIRVEQHGDSGYVDGNGLDARRGSLDQRSSPLSGVPAYRGWERPR